MTKTIAAETFGQAVVLQCGLHHIWDSTLTAWELQSCGNYPKRKTYRRPVPLVPICPTCGHRWITYQQTKGDSQ